MDRQKIMQQWDSWRKYIAEGGGGSWPTDAFESLLDSYDEKINEVERQLSMKSVDANIRTETPSAGSTADEQHVFSGEE